MKSIILTAQDARELDNLGSLTITKPIKPTPPRIEGASLTTEDGGSEWFIVDGDGKRLGAGDGVADLFAPPVEPGAAVFIREPWFKLKKPDGTPSGRIVLGGDCTVAEGQTAYKWASPVSMPEDSARRFARVISVAPIYNENVAEWAITLEIITKAEAQGEGHQTAQSEPDSPEEAPEPTEGGRSPSDEPQGEEPAAAEDEEDEEVGSFTLGKCKYCGREWGVTLEGSKEGGYPTQRTADAAATRLCDCPEAVENRAPVVGVAFAITTGVCRYCGQIQEVGPHPSQAAADETASEVCNCPDARSERRVFERVEDARERVRRLFGDKAEALGFKPTADEAVGLLEQVAEMIARGPISSASLNIRGQCKAKLSVTSKGKIKVSRSETRSCGLEDGE